MEADAAGLPFSFGLGIGLILAVPYFVLGLLAFGIFRLLRGLKNSKHHRRK